jgi:subtilisin family serine protease
MRPPRAARRAIAVLAVCAAVSGALPAVLTGAVAGAVPTDRARLVTPKVADDRILVGLAPGASAATAEAVARRAGAHGVARAGDTLIITPPADGAAPSLGSRAALDADPNVRYVEPNYEVRADVTPDDPLFPQQYGLQDSQPAGIRAQSAWNTTAGSPAVVVGVLDTGADLDHEDLAANLWSNDDGLLSCGFGTHGYDAVGDDCGPDDDDGHGTHVSGIVGGVGGNGKGIAGTAQHVSLMELRMLRRNPVAGQPATGSIADAIEAIDWALVAKAAGVNLRVLQASWGAYFPSVPLALQDAVARAMDAGVLFVTAAGNDGRNVDTDPQYPCAFGLANVVCVAATDQAGGLAGFSNSGPGAVDLAAPGVGILSTVPPGLVDACAATARYCALSGTSMATPFVSGGAADVVSALPALTVAQLRARILAAVAPLPALAGRVATGGRFDLCAAMPACGGSPITVPSAPQDLVATVTGSQVRLDWSLPASNGSGFLITGFRIRWGGDEAVLQIPVGQLAPPTTYTIFGLADDVDLPITVEAANQLPLSGAPWGPAAGTTVRAHPEGPPSVVRELAGTTDGHAATLTWQAPASAGSGGATITGYRITGPGLVRLLGVPAGAGAPPTTVLAAGVPTGTFSVAATNMLPLAGPGTVWGPAVDAVVSPAASGEYTAVAPARVLDTRSGTGGRLGALGASASYALPIAGVGGVPGSGVAAVVMNVTVTEPTAAGFLTVWATGAARPTISNLNFVAGQSVPNLVTVRVGVGGKVSFFNSRGATHVIADVVGYYAASDGSPGSRFHAVPPARAFDTRTGQGGIASAPIAGPGALRYRLTGKAGVPATGVRAVVMNVTVTEPTTAGFLAVYPDDVARPDASNLNFVPGQTVPNLVAVRVPTNGIVDFFNSAGASHVIADVVGYYDDVKTTEAGRFVAVDPIRLEDTRLDGSPLAAGRRLVVPVAGRGGVPELGAAAAVLNVTVTEPTAAGFVAVVPDDSCRDPLTSNLNFVPGQTVPNLAVPGLSLASACTHTVGAVDVFNSAGSTQVIADLFGWFTG